MAPQVVQGTAQPTVFSSATFSRAWARIFDLQWETLPGHDDLGLVFSESSHLGLRDYRLGPRGLYWSPGGDDGGVTLTGLALRYCLERRTLGMTWNFRYDSRAELDTVIAGLGEDRCRVTEAHTHVIDIEGKTFDDIIFKQVQPETRRRWRRSSEKDLEIRPLDSEDDFRSHYEIYDAWTRSVGAERHPPELFRGLPSALGDSLSFLGAFLDGDLLAATVVFHDDREWFYWHSVRDREKDRCFAVDALLAHTVGQACRAGALWYNMGASSGIASLEEFKERWGSEPRRIWSLRWLSPTWAPVMTGWQWLRRHTPGR